MKYTADQLVALVEEARGYVHDAAMGAIWTKERHAKLADFMERTDVVEYEEGGKKNVLKLQPLKRNSDLLAKGEKSLARASEIAANLGDCKDVFKKNPKETAQDFINLGYRGGEGSVDNEVAILKKRYGCTQSRDHLREVVKIVRKHFGK